MNEELGGLVIVFGGGFLADLGSLLVAVFAVFASGLEHVAPHLQLHWRQQVPPPTFRLFFVERRCLWLQHFLAQRRGSLGLLLHVAGQLAQLFFLLGREFIGFGAEELSLELGNIRSSLGQLLLELEGILDYLRGIGGQLAQQLCPAPHAQRASRNAGRSG